MRLRRSDKLIGPCLTVAGSVFLAATVLPFAAAGGAEADRGVAMSDDFDDAPLDSSRWSTYRAKTRRYWIDRHMVYSGKGALAVRVSGKDTDAECGCQQVEIREASDRRLTFGEEAWYSFTMRVRGTWPPTGPQRWVIGGWKQETDGSAFVAQRFDRGVFHITIESGQTRVLLASAQRDASGFLSRLAGGLLGGFEFVGEQEKYSGTSDLELEYGPDPILPDPVEDWVRMEYRIKGGVDGQGLVEVFANGKFIVRARGTIGVRQMSGSTQYLKIGHNRAPMPGTATLYIDDFTRSRDRID